MSKLKRLKAKVVKDNHLNVVHDDDLECLLRSLNVYESVRNGEKKCLFCDGIITMENIDSIVPYEGIVWKTLIQLFHTRVLFSLHATIMNVIQNL